MKSNVISRVAGKTGFALGIVTMIVAHNAHDDSHFFIALITTILSSYWGWE